METGRRRRPRGVWARWVDLVMAVRARGSPGLKEGVWWRAGAWGVTHGRKTRRRIDRISWWRYGVELWMRRWSWDEMR